jgi:cell division transport system permease protein
VPTLIDVTLTSGARVDTAALEARLADVAPGAAVDDHRRWLDGVIGLARVTFGLALAVVAIVGVVAAGAVIFVTRAKLAANREAIDLLHLMGADDHYIAGHFARQGLVQGIQGGIVGLLAAAAALAAMALVLRAVDPALGARATLSLAQAATLLLLPPLAGLIAMLTARRTVLGALARVI